MEIREIISFYVNTANEVLEVDFRLIEDDDSHVRTDEIELSELQDFGLKINHEHLDMMDDITEDYDDLDDEEEPIEELDRDELLSFLTEYYTVNPNKLPDASLF
jgi:hypothetical protein